MNKWHKEDPMPTNRYIAHLKARRWLPPSSTTNPVPAKYSPDFILIFVLIKMQKFSFSGFEKPVYAKLQINFI